MKWRNVSLFMPAFHGTFGTTGPFHQSQATLPGLIHEVSPISLGSARLVRIVDSTRSPGFAPSMRTRQGETSGRAPRTTTSGCEGSGASFVTSVGWRESFPPSTRAKCRPDHFRRLASASATTSPSPASIVSGGPTIDSGLMPRSGIGHELALVAGRERGELQHPGLVVGQEAEARVLGDHLHPVEAGLLRQDVAEGRAVVEGPEDDVQADRLLAGPLERHRHLLAAVAGLAGLAGHERVRLVAARALHVEDAEAARERPRLPQGEPEAGARHHRLPGVGHRVERGAVLGQREGHLDLAGRGLEDGRLGGERGREDGEQEEGERRRSWHRGLRCWT